MEHDAFNDCIAVRFRVIVEGRQPDLYRSSTHCSLLVKAGYTLVKKPTRNLCLFVLQSGEKKQPTSDNEKHSLQKNQNLFHVSIVVDNSLGTEETSELKLDEINQQIMELEEVNTHSIFDLNHVVKSLSVEIIVSAISCRSWCQFLNHVYENSKQTEKLLTNLLTENMYKGAPIWLSIIIVLIWNTTSQNCGISILGI